MLIMQYYLRSIMFLSWEMWTWCFLIDLQEVLKPKLPSYSLMKRVIIVGPDFSPSSYPPALRIRFFARHLPKFGWEPTVLTVQPQYYEWSVDPENERLLPESLEVIRTPALPARLTRKIGIGDIGIRSICYHWRALSRLCRKRHFDLIFIPVPPYVPMVLGRLIHRQFRIPYIIDYIDPWVTEYYWRLPKAQRPPKWALSYTMSRILEPFAVKQVRHIVGVSKGTTESVVARYSWLTAANTTEIPYGGELADFDYLCAHPRQNKLFSPTDGLIHLSYVGRGGPDMLPALKAVLEALRLGIGRSPAIFSKVRMHFVGTTYAKNAKGQYQVLPVAQDLGLAHLVDERPTRVSYLDALQVLLDSHGLLVIGSDAPHYTASKIFPYILARRPLLAVFHEDSSVVRILRETQAGKVVTFNLQQPPLEKVEEILKWIEEILSPYSNHQSATRWEIVEGYTTQAMAARLAQTFDNALSGSS